MMRSLFSGVSGLKSHQTRMDVIGNNIANVNTTGFKSSRTTFADTLSQTLTGASSPQDNLGGTNPKQIGLGTGVASIDMLFTDGSVQSTGKNTDLCLSGNGLFVVKQGNQTYYTRDGAFEFDAAGNYVLPSSGLYVQGWTATDGALNTSGDVGNIQIPAGKSMAAKASATGTYANNLNSEVATINKASIAASSTSPLVLTITDADGNTKTARVTSGTYAIGGTYAIDKTLTSGSATVSASVNPVSVTTAGGDTYTVSTQNTNMSYGYTTSTANASATASSKQTVNLYYNKNGVQTAIPGGTSLSSGSYQVGGTYTGTAKTSGRVTATTDNPVVLMLKDGTQHTVTDGTYVIGTDTYTYTPDSGSAISSTVTGASQSYTISSMDVLSQSGGLGTAVSIGGYAQEAGLSQATPDSNTTVIINGDIQKTSGGPYTLGATYTGDKITSGTSDAATTSKGIILYLEDGSEATGLEGISYTVGKDYTYTKDGTNTPVQTKIAGFAYTGTITSLAKRSEISSISLTEQGPISQITTSDGTVMNASTGVLATSSNPVTVSLSDGTTIQETNGSYLAGQSLPITTTLTVYDSLGAKHNVSVYLTKTGVETDASGNTTSKWAISLDTNHKTAGETCTQTITGDDGTTTSLTMNVAELVFDDSGKCKTGSAQPQLTLQNGSHTSQTISLDFSAVTQYASGSTIAGTADGNSAGTLSSVSVDSSGIITGTYTNGIKQTEAQVAVAQFTNASGLTKTGNSLYQESNNSGTANIKTASALGVTITPSALEMSNVDIANEFSDMIVTQRGFQSNSKIITVGDEMLETLINMKR